MNLEEYKCRILKDILDDSVEPRTILEIFYAKDYFNFKKHLLLGKMERSDDDEAATTCVNNHHLNKIIENEKTFYGLLMVVDIHDYIKRIGRKYNIELLKNKNDQYIIYKKFNDWIMATSLFNLTGIEDFLIDLLNKLTDGCYYRTTSTKLVEDDFFNYLINTFENRLIINNKIFNKVFYLQ